MTDTLSELYRELILDHGKSPRNHRVLEEADRSAEGYNPLCGDRVTVFMKTDDDRIDSATFTGAGCAICMASASLMTSHLKGKTTAEAMDDFSVFQEMVTAPADAEPPAELGKLVALAGVRRYPMRVKCATLAWHTMKAALEGERVEVSTE